MFFLKTSRNLSNYLFPIWGIKNQFSVLGVKTMREFSEQDKQRISKQFCSFCCSVLKNEANNIRAEYKHYADLEMNFSFLSDKEQAELYTFDCYFVTDNVFNVCDIRIIVSNNMLAEAINKLPCDLRDIVLLSYFANMPDIEIAKQLDLSYWIVFRARIRALKRLKAIISTEGIKWKKLYQTFLFQ